MIKVFNYPSQSNELDEYLLKNPVRHIWHDVNVMRVFTGEDMPEKPVARCDDLQFRLALAQLGLLDAVKDHVAASDAFVQSWWEKTRVFKADNPMLLQEAAKMDMTSQLASVIALAATMPSNT